MLTGIQFKNYKAFENGRIDIKPITILLGANSVGKSSIIQSFLLLQETGITQNYKSALKLHGGFFSLGEGINLFRRKDSKNTLNFSMKFAEPALKEMINREATERYLSELTSYCYLIIARYTELQSHIINDDLISFTKIKTHFKDFNRITSEKSTLKREDIINIVNKAADVLKKAKDKADPKESPSSLFYISNGSLINHALLNNKNELIETYDFLNSLSEIENREEVSLEFDFKVNEGILKIRTFNLAIGGRRIANVDFDKDIKDFITSDIFDLSKVSTRQKNELKKLFRDNRTIFSFIEDYTFGEHNHSISCSYFINTITKIIDKLEESFNSQRINYVSPLRAHPKRYYFLDKAKTNTFLDTLDGEAIAEIIKDNSGLRNRVNSWFKKFNLHIEVGPIKDIIHQIVVKQNSLDLDITDVGFGVSQVLPVIIQGFLSKEKSITLIEQPEIHLHPKMQADLADLFIDIAIKKHGKRGEVANKFLIIETHSEYLLKRLRHRISEGKLSPDQVALYYVEPQDGDISAVIRKIEIEPKGAFDWPKDFYTGDLAEDITEFIKNQTI